MGNMMKWYRLMLKIENCKQNLTKFSISGVECKLKKVVRD